MKIIELRFKNLNSLYGEWVINFSDSEFLENGIFAITGSTGAGKSTILDALSLALYGRTPRLDAINKTGGNEIMSRHTGECSAEVIFETQEGRYMATWQQRRSRSTIDGNLQDYTHTVVDVTTGKALVDKKNEVKECIAEITGLDFERFTRSILLAQGEFAAFLKSTSSERSEILEKITGTSFYADISKEVHRRTTEEKNRLETLRLESAALSVMSSDEEEELRKTVAREKSEVGELQKKSETVQKEIQRYTELDALIAQFHVTEQKQLEAQRQLVLFKPEEERMSLAQKAFELEGEYAVLLVNRERLAKSKADADALSKIVPELEQKKERLTAEFEKSTSDLTLKKEILRNEQNIIKEVVIYDTAIVDRNRILVERHKELSAITIELEKNTLSLNKIENEVALLQTEQETIKSYFSSHYADESLTGELGVLKSKIERIVELQTIIEKQRTRIIAQKESIVLNLPEIEKQKLRIKEGAALLKNRSSELKEVHETLKQTLGKKSIDDYSFELNHLIDIRNFQLKIVHFEDERKLLEDGKECPLCGALEHPFATGNTPAVTQTDAMIAALRESITEIHRLKDQERVLQQSVAESEVAQSQYESFLYQLTSKTTALERELCDFEKGLAENQEIYKNLFASVGESVAHYGITPIDEKSIELLIAELTSRRDLWHHNKTREQQLLHLISQNIAQIENLKGKVETLQKSLLEKQSTIDLLSSELKDLQEKRGSLYGSKVCSVEEERVHALVTQAELLRERIRAELDTAKKHVTEITAKMDSYKTDIDQLQSLVESLMQSLLEHLFALGFESEEKYCSAKMSREELSALEKRGSVIKESVIKLQTLIEEQSAIIQKKKSEMTVLVSITELRTDKETLSADIEALQRKIGSHTRQLEESELQRTQLKKIQEHIDSQKREFDRWHRLDALIGSSNGKVYRDFAQGLTFDVMISHANYQLQKMSDRYLLKRAGDSVLELNVIDTYQGCCERSTKNLSGGESFIISLALALGLSRMASKRVRIDSLFLDEGFGTLDEEALDIAIDTLAGLKEEGKLIGVISHVQALKDRIPTQIKVFAQAGGRSTLSGPGCRFCSDAVRV